MKLLDAKSYLKELTGTQPHGGEPFLCFDLLLHILEKAMKRGIAQTWVIANGFWAETKAIAR